MKLIRQLSGLYVPVRTTVTFVAGTTGAVGQHTLFTITGRVEVKLLSAFCTTDLAGATATISVGTVTTVDALIGLTTGTDIDLNDWWTAAAPAAGPKNVLEVVTGGGGASQGKKLLHENITYDVLTAALSAGTLVIDVLYRPISDDGLLVAA